MEGIDVSIILPVHNAEPWLEECLLSVTSQKFAGSLELSVYNDSSTDLSLETLRSWLPKLKEAGVKVVLSGDDQNNPKGVGFAKNRAVEQSSGQYLCFLDADDVMTSCRIQRQYEAAEIMPNAIIGCKFHRLPPNSTKRYTQWANSLSPSQLYTQIYTSHGPTLIMPTWFCSRKVFNDVGGFSETGKGTPEDLLFFFFHLQLGGILHRVDEDLLMYRYHPQATTFSIHENAIWNIRLKELEKQVLCNWTHFTIWNAGKQGKRFYRSLSPTVRAKVVSFCDVDAKKISKGVYVFEESQELPKPTVPIVHFTEAKPPFILCVKLDLTGGIFEQNLLSLHLKEGVDYYHFS